MEYLGAGFTLLTLAILIVMCGDVVPRRHQNWTTILIVSIGIPVFLVLMTGFMGIIVG